MNDYVEHIKNELDSINDMSLDEFNAMRNEKFRKMLSHHYNNTHNAAYRELLRKHGIESEEDLPKNVAEVNMLPMVDKEFLQRGDFANKPTVPRDEVFKVVETSGSTGDPKLLPHSLKAALRLYGELITRSYLMNNFDLEGEGYWVTHWIPNGKDVWSSHVAAKMIEKIFESKVIDETTQTSLDKHIENLLNNNRITRSVSASNFYIALASFAKKQNIDLSRCSLNGVISGGSRITESDREFVKEGIGLDRFAQFYVSSETFMMGAEAKENLQYHLQLDEFIIEIVDKDGNHVRENEKGEVLVTAFSMDSAPMIRYRISDSAMFLGKSDYIDKFSMLTDIGRVSDAPFGDGLISYDEIANMPKYMLSKGIPVLAVQIAKQRVDKKDLPIIRIESPVPDYEKIEALAIEAFTSNNQMKNEIESGIIHRPKVELYEPGKLRTGRFKIPLFIDETETK
ncbi:AMP-binding protein [Candidatus Woesearchaeota archaeon]|nr:AMP-binding protein [Candidatus Woesearchaeota archaeon]